jgi:phosphoribosylformylglycinamidine synthase subunit PurQ / glutaminase
VKKVRALVLTGFGINCQDEMAAAYRLAGADADVVHFNELLAGQASIRGYDVVNFPGGFSFGDDLGAGKALANKMRFCKLASGRTLLDEIADHVAAGGFVLGVCNGFQILVKSGLLPNVGGTFEQEVSLIVNDSGQFEDRWVHCRIEQPVRSPFLGCPRNPTSVPMAPPPHDLASWEAKVGGSPTDDAIRTILPLPVRHKEGKLVCRDDAIRAAILEKGLCALRYCDAEGKLATDYPALPNGAEFSCAALTDPTGRVLGMMPHPEAFLAVYNHPDWACRLEAAGGNEEGDGLRLFQNIVNHAQRSRAQ